VIVPGEHTLVDALGSQIIEPLGALALVIWLLGPDGELRMLGETGFDAAEAARWAVLSPSVDCPAQRVAHGGPDLWWLDGPPEGIGVLGPRGARAVLGLAGRAGDMRGVLEVCWPQPLPDEPPGLRERLTGLAAGCAGVLDVQRELSEPTVYRLLDSLAGPMLAVRSVRGPDGAVAGFRIVYVSDGYPDPEGRGAAALTGITLTAAYPGGTPLSGLARDALTGAPVTGTPAVARFFDGAVFSWRHAGEPGRLAALLENAQRIGRLGGWEEDLRTGAVYWTDSVFTLFGLAPGPGRGPGQANPIGIGDLHNYVVASDRAGIIRFREELVGSGGVASASFRIVRPDDGSVRQMLVSAEAVIDAGGAVTTLRGAYQDVSAQYHTQVALAATRDRLVDTEQRAAEEHQLALQLQRAIMPPDSEPARFPGIDVAVRYRPAGRGHLVGGDWYDSLLLPSGQVLLVVGDVAGHGIDAVTGMVAVRNSLRGLAVTGKGPAELVGLLNTLVCHLTPGVIGTMVCGLYDQASRVLRWARAGHLPPVLIRDGSASALPLPAGLLLGMEADVEYEEAQTPLSPGDVLLMFTDGLIERREHSITDSLDAFTTAAEEPGAATAAAHADRLLAAVVSDTDDDACLVAVRIHGEG
jgi:serine phosphatase RsbU (regulator of sigma subunit)